ncbi:SWIM zinc finger family protein [Halalkalicoccus salilacus]|uniref:SWIM zinc finger family protein n=1 Tax=Halalkalicoccus salilacus TaxID=3117459 RepID=UPI00300E9292
MSPNANRTEKSIVNDADQKTVQRAQYEAFEFELDTPGLVTVINASHKNPADHSYLVNVETDTPVACECKAFQYRDGPCKHMVAVAIREPVLKAAQSVPIPDGGKDMETCQNGQTSCCGPHGDELPCFECYQSQER